MPTGTRPDWENVGIEIPKAVQDKGLVMVRMIRGLSLRKMVEFMSSVSFGGDVWSDCRRKIMEDQSIRDYLEPRVKNALGVKFHIELTEPGGESIGWTYTIKGYPEIFVRESAPSARDPLVAGLRIRFDDLLDLIESCLQEGRFVLPDILDFYCRGKLELLYPERRADWSAVPLIGAMMWVGPEIWSIMSEEKVLDMTFDAITKVPV